MRIGYVVDVHDRFEAGRAIFETGLVDVLVVGGDITTFGGPDDAKRAVEPGGRSRRGCSRSRETATRRRSTNGSSSWSLAGRSRPDPRGRRARRRLGRPPLAAPHALRTPGRRARPARRRPSPTSPGAGTDLLPTRSSLRDGLRLPPLGRARRQPGASRPRRPRASRPRPLRPHPRGAGDRRARLSAGREPRPVASGHYALVDVGEGVTITLD